jgi:hypothetical protein
MNTAELISYIYQVGRGTVKGTKGRWTTYNPILLRTC